MLFRLPQIISLLTAAICWSVSVHGAPGTENMNQAPARHIPSPLYGVTIDQIDRLPSIVDSLKALSRKPTTRIVFDEKRTAHEYLKAVNEIHNVSYVMGELCDSYFIKNYTVNEYLQRTEDYLNTLGSKVDIWEVGNEINGDWLGDTPSVLAKMTGGYDMVKARGGKTALTLYHDQESEWLLEWAEKNVPERMKQGLDYVFISFYDDDQKHIKPDWEMVFKRLAAIFPNSKVGFGEVGTDFHGQKKSYIQRYYNMNIAQQNFVGGYFWWWYKQDMVPRSKPLWKVLNKTLTTATARRGS